MGEVSKCDELLRSKPGRAIKREFLSLRRRQFCALVVFPGLLLWPVALEAESPLESIELDFLAQDPHPQARPILRHFERGFVTLVTRRAKISRLRFDGRRETTIDYPSWRLS